MMFQTITLKVVGVRMKDKTICSPPLRGEGEGGREGINLSC